MYFCLLISYKRSNNENKISIRDLCMNFFRNNPFVKILGFWISGLLIAKFCPVILLLFILSFGAGMGWYLHLSRHRRYPFDPGSSALLAILILLLSGLNYRLDHPQIPSGSEDDSYFRAIVLEKPTAKAHSFQTILKIEQAENDSLNNQQLICRIEKGKLPEDLKAGDQLYCKSKISRIENTGNPYEFDYRNYMALQGIHFRTYLRLNAIHQIGERKLSLKILAENFREKLLSRLRSKLKKHESFEVISALTLGYRKELMPETLSSFTNTGAMHVLAVSGLHVGMIFFFLMRLFSFLKHSKYGNMLRFCLIISLLWSYALITGMSPSVMRASLMFSILLAAESIRRTNSVYNSIATSAFVLLLLNPDILFEVGFQLSYAAVLSIIYFYPLLDKIVQTRIIWLKKPWQLVCVSVAAQIGTFPFTIYYFNQFPVYFWLSNLVVIPAAFLLLSLTFLFFIAAPIPALCELTARLLDTFNSAMLFLLNAISHLPHALISGFAVSPLQLSLLVMMVLLIVLFISYREKKYLALLLSSFLLFQLFSVVAKVKMVNQQKIIHYKGNSGAIHFITARKNYIFCPDTTRLNAAVYSNVVNKLHLAPPVIIQENDLQEFNDSSLIFRNGIIQFGEQTYRLSTRKTGYSRKLEIRSPDKITRITDLKNPDF